MLRLMSPFNQKPGVGERNVARALEAVAPAEPSVGKAPAAGASGDLP